MINVRQFAIVSLAGAACAALTGCGAPAGPQPPKTYPAAGKVTFIGGKPFPGGVITFTSKGEPQLVMDAPIGDDGSFELSMMFGNKRLSGAAEGSYQVMVSSRFAGKSAVKIYVLASPVAIEPKDNHLTIEVDPATARR